MKTREKDGDGLVFYQYIIYSSIDCGSVWCGYDGRGGMVNNTLDECYRKL